MGEYCRSFECIRSEIQFIAHAFVIANTVLIQRTDVVSRHWVLEKTKVANSNPTLLRELEMRIYICFAAATTEWTLLVVVIYFRDWLGTIA